MKYILLIITFSFGAWAQEKTNPSPQKEVIKEVVQPQKKTVVNEVKKPNPKNNVKVIKKVDTIKFNKEEMNLLRKRRLEQLKKRAMKNKGKKKKKAIYEPAPLPSKNGYTGYELKRGTPTIIEEFLTVKDEMKVKMCLFSGLDIVFDSDSQDTIQRIILDDQIFFGQQVMGNNKGVHVQLIRPIMEDEGYVETTLRIYRAKDDMPYIINLLGVPCPNEGLVKFPKLIVLKEKNPGIFPNKRVRPPEDTIIEESYGYKPKYQNKIRVYDMIVDSASDWVVFGVELQLKDNRKKLDGEFKILDSLQINQMQSYVEELRFPSIKATNLYQVPTKRFNIKVKMDKEYMMRRRYVHLMFIDHDTKSYQYFRINTMLWLTEAIKRGFRY